MNTNTMTLKQFETHAENVLGTELRTVKHPKGGTWHVTFSPWQGQRYVALTCDVTARTYEQAKRKAWTAMAARIGITINK